MTAVEVMESLIKLGTVIADASANHRKDSKFDFISFLKSDDAKNVKDAVNSILESLKKDELKAAITSVERKQKDILAGKQVVELSVDKLVQYSSLIDTKLLLTTAIVKRNADKDFFNWLLNDGLASILKIAKIAIPLLV